MMCSHVVLQFQFCESGTDKKWDRGMMLVFVTILVICVADLPNWQLLHHVEGESDPYFMQIGAGR